MLCAWSGIELETEEGTFRKSLIGGCCLPFTHQPGFRRVLPSVARAMQGCPKVAPLHLTCPAAGIWTVSSQLLTSGAAVYTYNTGVANSLTKTSVQVR